MRSTSPLLQGGSLNDVSHGVQQMVLGRKASKILYNYRGSVRSYTVEDLDLIRSSQDQEQFLHLELLRMAIAPRTIAETRSPSRIP